MNTLWHFGDSWGTCDEKETIFSKYVATHYGMYHFNYSTPGYSNRSIFEEILKYSNSFKSGDYILINWSYYGRLDFILTDENGEKHIRPTIIENTPKYGYFNWILDGAINWGDYEYYKLFLLINHHLKNLEQNNITIFYTIQDSSKLEPQIHGNQLPFNLNDIFQYDFWVRNNGWEIQPPKNGNHYILGIQQELANEYIKRMDSVIDNTSL